MMQYQLTHYYLVMVLLYLIYFSCIFGSGGINIKNLHFTTNNAFCLFVCVCVCVSICLYVGMHYKMESCWRRNYGIIISNISAYISPVRLCDIPGDLVGESACVSGWDKTLDSKYTFFIISHFNFKNCTYQNDCFKGEETHGLQKFMWSM